MDPVWNDPVKLRELSDDMRKAAGKFHDEIDKLRTAHNKLVLKCRDDKIDEFGMDFKRTCKSIEELETVLKETAKHLDGKADEFERMQRI
jgi:uncharacterized protein YukE